MDHGAGGSEMSKSSHNEATSLKRRTNSTDDGRDSSLKAFIAHDDTVSDDSDELPSRRSILLENSNQKESHVISDDDDGRNIQARRATERSTSGEINVTFRLIFSHVFLDDPRQEYYLYEDDPVLLNPYDDLASGTGDEIDSIEAFDDQNVEYRDETVYPSPQSGLVTLKPEQQSRNLH